MTTVDNIAPRFEPEEYEVVTSDNRRFIVRTADPDGVRQDFLVPGDAVRVLSVKPIFVRENLLTVQQLAKALAVGCDKPPHWQTLRSWANQRIIPSRRLGKRFMRFVEKDVRRAMEKMEERA